jgi:DNA-binding XRE family transcriptional regulator
VDEINKGVVDMKTLKTYISERKSKDKAFAKDFDRGYEDFKIGVILKQVREEAGLSQSQLAQKIGTQKTSISRIENHAEDIKLSTLEKVALALGRQLRVSIA